MTEEINILLVDDEPGVIRLLQRMLEPEYRCRAAGDVKSARQCLENTAFDLLITDILMPDESGIQLIRFVRTHFPDMAVVVVSGVSGQQDTTPILEAGVYGYIVKPFLQEQLLITVENALRRSRLENRQRMDRLLLTQAVAAKTRDLEQSHRQTASLISAITSIIIGLSPDGRVIQWNNTAEKVLGVSARHAVGNRLENLKLSWGRERIQTGIDQCIENGNPLSLDHLKFRRMNGKQGFLGLRISMFECSDSGSDGVLIMGADITDRILLETQLAQAQKLESIGQLAAGIAHEINTPTQYVGDNLRFFQEAFVDLTRVIHQFQALLAHSRQTDPDQATISDVEQCTAETDLDYLMEEVPRAIQQALEGVGHISRIVLSMKEFSHPGIDEKKPVDINKALTNTYTVARNEWKYVADLITDFDPDLPLVFCYPGELNQAFLNIIINAAHAIESAMPEGSAQKGTIHIATRVRDDRVEVEIRDSGCGIPADIRHRIFDPFFTTKEVGQGTGQGLAIVHNVVTEKHGGVLQVESQPGQGTTFTIQLPIGEKA